VLTSAVNAMPVWGKIEFLEILPIAVIIVVCHMYFSSLLTIL